MMCVSLQYNRKYGGERERKRSTNYKNCELNNVHDKHCG